MSPSDDFLKYLQYEKRSSVHTVTAYRTDLDQFIQYMNEMSGDFDIEKINQKHIRSWIVSLMDSGVSARSVNRKISTLKSFFKYLMREGLLENNPALLVTKPKVSKKLPFFVSEEELNQLLDLGLFTSDFEGSRDKLIISLLYGTGIRLSELKNLSEASIDLKEYTVRVLGKRNKERIVPYPKSLNPVFQEYFEKRESMTGKSHFLFLTSKGEQVYDKLIYRVVNKYLTMVTTISKRSPHVLRHSFATHLLNHGANLNAVKELLGHSNLSATQIYTHTSFDQLNQIYKQAHPRS